MVRVLTAMQTRCKDCGHALVAQLDRAPDYESGGREFESSRARHFFTGMTALFLNDAPNLNMARALSERVRHFAFAFKSLSHIHAPV